MTKNKEKNENLDDDLFHTDWEEGKEETEAAPSENLDSNNQDVEVVSDLEKITLERSPWMVPEYYELAGSKLTPFFAGTELSWRLLS